MNKITVEQMFEITPKYLQFSKDKSIFRRIAEIKQYQDKGMMESVMMLTEDLTNFVTESFMLDLISDTPNVSEMSLYKDNIGDWELTVYYNGEENWFSDESRTNTIFQAVKWISKQI